MAQVGSLAWELLHAAGMPPPPAPTPNKRAPAHQARPQPLEQTAHLPPQHTLPDSCSSSRLPCVRPSFRTLPPTCWTTSFSELTPGHHPAPPTLRSPAVAVGGTGGLVHMCHLSTRHRTWRRPGVQYLLSLHGVHPSSFSFHKCSLSTRATAVRRQARLCSSVGDVPGTETYMRNIRSSGSNC